MVRALEDLFSDSIRRRADCPAVTCRDHRMTYGELSAAADRLAGLLAAGSAGYPLASERVGILAPNMPCFVAALLAAWRVGAVAMPLNARWREYDLGQALQDAEPQVLISVGSHRGYSFVDLMTRLLPELPAVRRCLFVDPMGAVEGEWEGAGVRGQGLGVRGQGVSSGGAPVRGTQSGTGSGRLDSEVALILYTSGTTGKPKGALIPWAAEVDGARCLNERLSATPGDVAVFVIPISHAFGLTCLLASLSAGSHVVLVDSTFSPEPMVSAIRGHGATVLHGSPAVFTALLKSSLAEVRTLRTGLVAGAPCPASVLEQLDGVGMRLLNLYGMTEIGAAACTRPDDPPGVRYSTVGRPLPGYEFRIDETAGGELQVRGPAVTPGYYRQPEATAAAFKEGWFRTGDLGSRDEQGNLRISGRAKELVTVAGLNVFPAEVEGLLLTHPDVLQAAVIGIPHETTGEALQAFVVARPGSGLTPADLLQFARPKIAGYKLPYSIHLLPELPLLASGKPDRAALQRFRREESDCDCGTGAHAVV